jgi:hypothetical protein
MIDAALRDLSKWLAATPLSNTMQMGSLLVERPVSLQVSRHLDRRETQHATPTYTS